MTHNETNKLQRIFDLTDYISLEIINPDIYRLDTKAGKITLSNFAKFINENYYIFDRIKSLIKETLEYGDSISINKLDDRICFYGLHAILVQFINLQESSLPITGKHSEIKSLLEEIIQLLKTEKETLEIF